MNRLFYVVIGIILLVIFINLFTPTGYFTFNTKRCDMGYRCVDDFKLVYQYGNCDTIDIKICAGGCFSNGCAEE
ncbi:MAG: hypothetical protein AB1571_00720 [Nanoarchaeota archaeon]